MSNPSPVDLYPHVAPLTGQEVWSTDPPKGEAAVASPGGTVSLPGAAVVLPDDRFAGEDPAIGAPPDPWQSTTAVRPGQHVALTPSGELVVTDGGTPTAAVRLTNDKFAASTGRTPPVDPRSFAQPWIITDDAVDDLDRALAVPEPEVGAAVLGPRGSRMITGLVVDPVRCGSAEYQHSDDLRERLDQVLAQRPELSYLGTAHSHPAGMAAPSGPDRSAFRSILGANPHVRDLVFPIVVDRPAIALDAAYQGGHLLDLPHGSIAAFTAVADGATTHLAPVPLTVVPVRAHTSIVAGRRGWTVRRAQVVLGPAASPWLCVDFLDGETRIAQVLLPAAYPLAAPLVRRSPGDLFGCAGWVPAQNAVDQLDAALTPGPSAAGRPAPASTGPASVRATAAVVRAGLRARISYHLPVTRDWQVAVLGAGSVGSVMAEALVRSGIRQLTLVDPDRVDVANLSRTVYTSADLGRPKVEALADRLAAVSPDVEVTALAEPIGGDGGRLDALALVDLAVLATDDPLAELVVNAALYPAGVAMVCAKLFARADAGEVLLVEPDLATPCLRCLTAGRPAGGDRSVDYGSGRLVAELALGPDIAGLAQRAAKMALALLARRGPGGPLAEWIAPLLREGRTMHLTGNVDRWGIFGRIDLGPLDGPYPSLWARTSRDPDCPVCVDPRGEPIAAFRGLPAGLPVPEPDMALPGEAPDGEPDGWMYREHGHVAFDAHLPVKR